MALKALLLRKQINDATKTMDAMKAEDEALKKREADLEKAIEEVETDEQREAVQGMVEEYEADKESLNKKKSELKDQIDDLERQLAECEAQQAEASADAEKEKERKDESKMENRDEQIMQERQAFADYCRGIIEHRSGEAYNMTKGNNGAVIPTSIAQEIIKKVADISPIYEKATKIFAKGTLKVPSYPASADHVMNAGYMTELTAVTASAGDITSVDLTGFLTSALTLVSNSLINNADVDIVPFVVDAMADAFASFLEGEFINGTENKIAGLSGISNSKTAGKKSSVTADELIELQGKVKDVYQRNACWIMAPATRDAIRKLKDGNSRYLLNNDLASEFGTTLLGKPVYVSDNMPAMGTAGNKAIIYGDLTGLTIKMPKELEIKVLKERFADQYAVGVVGFADVDAKVTNQQKLAVLAMGSSDT